MQFDYGWKWFDFHAKQRMQLFNFFLIITGILVNAYVNAYEANLHLMSLAVCGLGTLQAFGFFFFDLRSRELTRYGEDILEALEYRHIYEGPPVVEGVPFNPETLLEEIKALFWPPPTTAMTPGILRRERTNLKREGYGMKRKWKSVFKMKIWIRMIQVIVGTAFLVGFGHAVFKTFTEGPVGRSGETEQESTSEPTEGQTAGEPKRETETSADSTKSPPDSTEAGTSELDES